MFDLVIVFLLEPFIDDYFEVLTKISNLDGQVPIFIAEIAPKNLRGGLTTLNQVRGFRDFCAHNFLPT